MNKYPTAKEILENRSNELNAQYASLEKEYENSTDEYERKSIRAKQKKVLTRIKHVTKDLLQQSRFKV